MSSPYLSEIRMFSFGFAPRGWVACNGQILPINQYAALFSLLGTTFGGNGVNTFALPNLQGRVPLHMGTATGGSYSEGQVGGSAGITLNSGQMAMHTHIVQANSSANSNVPSGNAVPGGGGVQAYGNPPNTPMNANITGMAGGSLQHPNLQPYLVVNFCIAISGIFPSRG